MVSKQLQNTFQNIFQMIVVRVKLSSSTWTQTVGDECALMADCSPGVVHFLVNIIKQTVVLNCSNCMSKG